METKKIWLKWIIGLAIFVVIFLVITIFLPKEKVLLKNNESQQSNGEYITLYTGDVIFVTEDSITLPNGEIYYITEKVNVRLNTTGKLYMDWLRYINSNNDNLTKQGEIIKRGEIDRITDPILQEKSDKLIENLEGYTPTELMIFQLDGLLWQLYDVDDMLNPKGVTMITINPTKDATINLPPKEITNPELTKKLVNAEKLSMEIVSYVREHQDGLSYQLYLYNQGRITNVQEDTLLQKINLFIGYTEDNFTPEQRKELIIRHAWGPATIEYALDLTKTMNDALNGITRPIDGYLFYSFSLCDPTGKVSININTKTKFSADKTNTESRVFIGNSLNDAEIDRGYISDKPVYANPRTPYLIVLGEKSADHYPRIKGGITPCQDSLNISEELWTMDSQVKTIIWNEEGQFISLENPLKVTPSATFTLPLKIQITSKKSFGNPGYVGNGNILCLSFSDEQSFSYYSLGKAQIAPIPKISKDKICYFIPVVQNDPNIYDNTLINNLLIDGYYTDELTITPSDSYKSGSQITINLYDTTIGLDSDTLLPLYDVENNLGYNLGVQIPQITVIPTELYMPK